jgi:hypothetical protein
MIEAVKWHFPNSFPRLPIGAQEYTPSRPQKGLLKFSPEFIPQRDGAEYLPPHVLPHSSSKKFLIAGISKVYWHLACHKR